MNCNIIQHGVDGFGHQLYGLFTSLILHNIKNYIFRADIFINKHFKFDHVSIDEELELKKYIIEAITNFEKDNTFDKQNINKHIHSHEVYKIPNNYDLNTVYSIDNAYYFEKNGLSEEEKIMHTNNINNFKKYFIENKYLPQNRLEKNSIVIHIRLGDAMNYSNWANEINENNKKIHKALNILKDKYPNYKIYIHSNGTPDFLNNIEYTFFDKNTSVLQFLSDVINANIFICSPSALSKVMTFFTKAETVIIPDDTKHSVDTKCIKISDFINNK